MIKILTVSLLLFSLSGCSTICKSFCENAESTDVVVETKYVIRKASSELFEIPIYPKKINLETATQKDLAVWIVESEGRAQTLENNIRSLKTFQDAPIKVDEINLF